MRIAVFASGSGSNAENIIHYFSNSSTARVSLILTNNEKAGVIERARRLNIPMVAFKKDQLTGGVIVKKLKEENIGFIVLAGFLLLMPDDIINPYRGRIVNIHPALLPQHGGKGFYGDNVHKAVIHSGAIMSGISIHHVNEKFDEGEIIFQAACHVSKTETSQSLAEKIHSLEYKYFPVVIEKVIKSLQEKPESV